MLFRNANIITKFTAALCIFLISALPIYADTVAELETVEEEAEEVGEEVQENTGTCEQLDEDNPLVQEINQLKLKKSKFDLEQSLQDAEFEKTLISLQRESRKLELENALKTAKDTQLKAELEELKTRLELENAIETEKQTKMLTEYETKRKKLEMENAIQTEKNRAIELDIQLKTSQLNFEMARLELERAKRNLDTEMLAEKINERDIKRQWESQVNKDKEYLKEPFTDGHLTISDRRISLNGFIFSGTAEYVTERLHYFNNKTTEYPIFLVIDRSPGGSVMEAMRIIEAMHASQSPVYVVVKSFAASAAAMITTLAERSYAYPNAIILHHQVIGGAYGNPVHHRESLAILEEWARRTTIPVAAKMGLTLEEFVEQMYEHNSDGDWREFADEAAKLKWVDFVVKDVRESSYIDQPREEEEEIMALAEQVDEKGRAYVRLPTLDPVDVYHIYNPNNYYRW